MIPLIDLQEQQQRLREELLQAIARTIDSAQFVLGPEVEAFEREFAALHGPDFEAVGVNSGTSALHLALLACGVGQGDEVLTSAYSFLATAEAIRHAGAKPVFVDIDPHCHTIDVRLLAGALTPRTKAIIPVHLFGQTAEMAPLLAFAREHGLAVIEDAAQAHLAEYHGQKAGSMGDAGCFSFYPSKNLGACGEGGLVLTNDPGRAAKLRRLRDWGQRQKGVFEIPGFNYRMDGIQAAILRVKLQHLPEWNETRRRRAALYDERLEDSPVLGRCLEVPGRGHVYHLYPVRSRRRKDLRHHLAERDIGSGIHYPQPLHLLAPWAHLGYRSGDFPEAEALAREELSLPMYPEMTAEQVQRVAAAVNEFSAMAG